MKRLLIKGLVLIMSLLLSLPVGAQSRVEDIYAYINSATSVIREVGAEEYIVLVNDGSESMFHWISLANTPASIKSISLGSPVVITDMYVVNQWVVFCGTYSNVAVVGWFDFNDLKSGSSVNLKFAEFNSPSHDIGFNTMGLRKIVCYAAGSEYHAIVIGYGEHPAMEATLIDLIFNPKITTSTYKYEFLRSGEGIDWFESLAVVDDFVVVSGRHKFVSKPGFRIIEKVYGTGNFIFSTIGFTMWTNYNWIQLDPISSTFATNAGNRIIVVLDAINPPIPVNVPPSYGLCVVRPGTAYNCRYIFKSLSYINIFGALHGAVGRINGDVYVMQDIIDTPSPKSVLFNTPLSPAPIVTLGMYDPNTILQSSTINNMGSGKIVSTRVTGALPSIYQYSSPSSSGCLTSYQLNLCNDGIPIIQISDPRPIDFGDCRAFSLSAPQIGTSINQMCTSNN